MSDILPVKKIDTRKSKKGGLFLSAHRKCRKNSKGTHNLVLWRRKRQRQNELAAQREAGLLSDEVQETSSVVQNLSSVQQASSAQIYSEHADKPVHKTPQNTNNTDLIFTVPQDINYSQILSSSVENSCAVQQTSSKHSNEPALKTSLNTNISFYSSSLPVVLNTNDNSSISANLSTAIEDTSQAQRTLRAQKTKVRCCSVATQMDFDTFKIPKKPFNTLYRQRYAKSVGQLPKVAPVRGRRIIDFQYFFNAIKDVNNHSKDANNHSKSGCNLDNIFIVKEKKQGIRTSFCLKCAVCNFRKVIWSEEPKTIKKNLNTQFVSGILSIKSNFLDANVLLSKMCLPLLKPNDFSKYEKFCGKLRKVDCKKTKQNISKKLGKNVQDESQLTAVQQCSSASENNSLKQVDLGGLLIVDQFEIKEEGSNISETIVPDQIVRTSNDELIASQEQVIFPTSIKQEINSIVEDLSGSLASETSHKENIIEANEQSVFREVLPQLNEERACEKRMIVKQGQVNLHENVMIKNNKINMLIEPEFNAMEIVVKESRTDFESELPHKKARTITCTESNNSADAQNIPIRSSSKNMFQTRFKSNGLVSTTSTTCVENLTATSTARIENLIATSPASGGNLAVASPKTTGRSGSINYFIPEHVPRSNGSDALILPQSPHNIASGIYQGVSQTAYMPGVPSAIQQLQMLSKMVAEQHVFPYHQQ